MNRDGITALDRTMLTKGNLVWRSNELDVQKIRLMDNVSYKRLNQFRYSFMRISTSTS